MTSSAEVMLFKFSTAFQLLNGLAYLEYLEGQNKKISLVICYEDYWKRNNIDRHYISFAVGIGAKAVTSEELKEIERDLKERGCRYTRLVINHGIQFPFSKRSAIAIDDGVGAYRTNMLSSLKALIKERGVTGNSYFYCTRSILAKLAMHALSKKFPAEHFGLFSQNSVLSEDHRYIKHARSILKRISAGRAKLAQLDDIPEGAILFLTQPAVQLNWIASEDYRRLIEKINNWAITTQRSTLVIKKHPIDSFDYGDIPCLSFIGMAEELFVGGKVAAVVSISSTSTITAKLLFGIPAYTIKLEDSPIDENKLLAKIFSRHTEQLSLI